jgi:myo-inositol-1(or 4)-monophosphatase
MKESFFSYTTVAINAALKAGQILKKGFQSSFSIFHKEGVHNLVTEYDLLAEKSILKDIFDTFPNHSILSEEKGLINNASDYEWIIDPLDGTTSFAHSIPFFSVSIALAIRGEVVSGVVYQPISNELFIGQKGYGAFLNGSKLSVSTTNQMKDAFLAVGFPYDLDKNPHGAIEKFTSILRRGIAVRRLGSAALDLAYVAAGRFDGFFEAHLKPWDCAAGILLIEESVGKVTNWKNEKYLLRSLDGILATNGKIHDEVFFLFHEK